MKLHIIGENRKNDDSVRLKDAHATAQHKVNPLVHVHFVSLDGPLVGWAFWLVCVSPAPYRCLSVSALWRGPFLISGPGVLARDGK